MCRTVQFISAVVVCQCVMVGCNDSTNHETHRLVGAWQGEVHLDEDRIPAEVADVDIDNVKATALVVTFGNDGAMSLEGNVSGRFTRTVGKWEIVSSEGGDVVIKSSEKDVAPKDIQIHFDDGDSFSMPLPGPLADAGSLKFRRIR